MSKGQTWKFAEARRALFAKIEKRPAKRALFSQFWRKSIYLFKRELGTRRQRRTDAKSAWRNVQRGD